jgi:hypothetical protein
LETIVVANGNQVFLGLIKVIKEGSVEDGYFVQFINTKNEVRKFSLTREAFEALFSLKPHADFVQYEPEVWTEVRSQFKETSPGDPEVHR